MVTRPLSTDELKAQGFFSHQMCYDSRTLLHYFRLMPDNRFLFGLRGAVSASSVAARAVESRLLSNFRRMFPHWETVEAPYFWTGLACIARNRVPFAGPLGDLPDAWGAMAYHGNGVAMGSYCGRLTAELALGRKTRPHPGFMQNAPRKFELGRFRRAQLRIAYAAYKWMDK
jgi:glycine/D-amino acid oxidase-like deaminating enzyme